ncbi:MAG: ABC transporter substrate-binding protein [Desulfurococcales archaeon]|nr:ABC transporter substrate-binding protein [Desulfurococcales archaeon]
MQRGALAALAIIIIIVVGAAAALLAGRGGGAQSTTSPTATTGAGGQATSAAGGSSEYPWLDELVKLAKQRGAVYDSVELTIITRHDAAIQKHTKELFLNSPVAKALNITGLNFVQLGPDLWLTYLQRAKQRGISYDVAWGGGPTIFNVLDENGFLMPLDNSTHPEFNAVLYEVAKLPKRYGGAPTYKVGGDGFIHWVGAAVASFGFTVNKQVAQELSLPIPKTWEDLASPTYAMYLPDKPVIGGADPTKSTSNTRMYEIILQAYGWEKGWEIITRFAGNAKIFDASDAVRDAVIRGDILAGLTIDFYGYTAMHQNPNTEYIIPKGLTIVNADPIAVLSTTKYPIRAAAFMAWVLSEYGGQQVWLFDDVNRLPINPKVFDTPRGQQRGDLHDVWVKVENTSGINFSDARAESWEFAMQQYFLATLVNLHEELQSTWAALAQAYLDGKITEAQFEQLAAELGKPLTFTDPETHQNVTFTEDYAKQINDKLRNGPVLNAYLNAWEAAARQRYQQVYQELQQLIGG